MPKSDESPGEAVAQEAAVVAGCRCTRHRTTRSRRPELPPPGAQRQVRARVAQVRGHRAVEAAVLRVTSHAFGTTKPDAWMLMPVTCRPSSPSGMPPARSAGGMDLRALPGIEAQAAPDDRELPEVARADGSSSPRIESGPASGSASTAASGATNASKRRPCSIDERRRRVEDVLLGPVTGRGPFRSACRCRTPKKFARSMPDANASNRNATFEAGPAERAGVVDPARTYRSSRRRPGASAPTRRRSGAESPRRSA